VDNPVLFSQLETAEMEQILDPEIEEMDEPYF
jgi:hypothetical protein